MKDEDMINTNPYFPPGQEDIDKESLGEDAVYLACEIFGTDEPTPSQIYSAEQELIEHLEAKGADLL